MAHSIFKTLGSAVFLVLLGGLFVLLQGCHEENLVPLVEKGTPITFLPVENTIKPALAVRAPGCLLCHGTVNGDIVTDLGYGSPFFFGRGTNHTLGVFTDTQANWLNTAYGSWLGPGQFGNIESLSDPQLTFTGGNLYLPHVRLDPVYEGTTAFLANFLATNSGLTPALQAAVIEKEAIRIAAPTQEDIRNLIQIYSLVEITVSKYFHALWIGSGTKLTHLIAQFSPNSRSNFYITNDGPIDCFGDVVIDGTLYLKNLMLNTDQGGCRLYVTGSVFVQGVPTYTGVTADQGANLQISSARGIFLGMSTISDRLSYAFGLRGASSIQAQLVFNQSILDDRDKIDGLTDDSGYYQTRSLGATVIGYYKDLDAGGIWWPAPGYTQDQVTNCTTCTTREFRERA